MMVAMFVRFCDPDIYFGRNNSEVRGLNQGQFRYRKQYCFGLNSII